MDFSLNELQTMLADSISRFIDNEYDFDTRQAYADSERGFSDAVWAKFAELGWTSVPFSEDDGGDALSLQFSRRGQTGDTGTDEQQAQQAEAGGAQS